MLPLLTEEGLSKGCILILRRNWWWQTSLFVGVEADSFWKKLAHHCGRILQGRADCLGTCSLLAIIYGTPSWCLQESRYWPHPGAGIKIGLDFGSHSFLAHLGGAFLFISEEQPCGATVVLSPSLPAPLPERAAWPSHERSDAVSCFFLVAKWIGHRT